MSERQKLILLGFLFSGSVSMQKFEFDGEILVVEFRDTGGNLHREGYTFEGRQRTYQP